MALSANDIFWLNNMNRTAEKVGLGTAIGNLDTSAASMAAYIAQMPFAIVKAGSHTTAGGDAAETITVTGAVATDIAIVVVHTTGETPVSIVAAAAATDSIAVTMSADPSTDHVLKYILVRAVT